MYQDPQQERDKKLDEVVNDEFDVNSSCSADSDDIENMINVINNNVEQDLEKKENEHFDVNAEDEKNDDNDGDDESESDGDDETESDGDDESENDEYESENNDSEKESKDVGKSGIEEIRKYCPIKKDQMIKDKYKIIKKLGWGRFSVVWKAIDTEKQPNDNNYEVAIKIYKSSEEYEEYYRNEKNIYNILVDDKHKNVVQALETFYIDSEYGTHGCFVFEICGEHLLKLLNKADDGGLPKPIVKTIVKQVLEGLDFIHGKGLIHTDIKPENILLTVPMKKIESIDQIQVKLSDLGSSTTPDNLYSLGEFTPLSFFRVNDKLIFSSSTKILFVDSNESVNSTLPILARGLSLSP